MAFAVAKLSECTLAGLFPEDLVVEKHAKDVSSKSQDTRRKIGAQSRKSREAQERTVERIRLVGVQVKEAERISDATLKPLSIDPEEFCKRVCDEIKKRRKESEESVALKSRIEAVGCSELFGALSSYTFLSSTDGSLRVETQLIPAPTRPLYLSHQTCNVWWTN